jgi:hypothetical protein
MARTAANKAKKAAAEQLPAITEESNTNSADIDREDPGAGNMDLNQ